MLKEFANKLTGRESAYPQFTKEETDYAKENGIVIVYGASDDLLEFDGAFYDEAGVFDGGTVTLNNESVVIDAKWCEDKDENGNVIAWTYNTNVEHETFDIVEDDEIYCRGFVFFGKDLELD